MNKAGWRLVLLTAVVGTALMAPAIATAAAPPSTPITIKSANFNSGLDGFVLSGINLSSEPYTTAYWGRTTGASVNERRGSSGNGLWCASTYFPAGTPRNYSNTYPKYTRGKAELDLSVLQHYYSSSLSFYYIMSSAETYPARGASDMNSLSVYWDDVAGNNRQADYTFDTTLASWVRHTENLSDPENSAVLSRKAGRLTFQWFDFIEPGGSSPTMGRGPTLDDITITGFKYGPVRNLTATPGEGSIELSWGTPDRATDDPVADDRVITYRVWRVVHGGSDWIELTSGSNRVAGLVYTDSTAVPGTLYRYAVQAWDPGTGAGYGTYVTTTASALADTAAPIVSSNAVGEYDDVASITISATDSGSGVKEIRYRIDGGVEQIAAGASKTVVILTAGPHSLQFWALDNAGNVSASQTKNFSVIDTQPPSVWANAGATYTNAASIKIGAEDVCSDVKEIHYRLDADAPNVVAGSSATVSVSAPGAYTLEYWAVDNAGNQSSPQERDFTITAGAVVTARLADRSRLDTAVDIGRTAFDPAGDKTWPGITDIIIASGDDRGAADPLAAAGLVWRYNAPLFLVSANSATPTSLNNAIAEIAAANGAIKVHIVGGPVAVPDARYAEIRTAAEAGGGSVVDATAADTRVMGAGGRYGTAARIAELMSEKADPPVVFIANGADYAKFSDALALSAISAQKGYPIFLVQQGSAPQATLDAIAARHKGDRVIVAGGVNTVADAAARQAAAAATYTWSSTNDRWAGQNRYLTATAIASKSISAGWLSSSTIGVAAKLPDALAGGAFVGYRNGVLLLTPSDYLWGDTATWIASRKATVNNSYVFGGTSSLTDGVRSAIDTVLE